jgi:hypothetical protein
MILPDKFLESGSDQCFRLATPLQGGYKLIDMDGTSREELDRAVIDVHLYWAIVILLYNTENICYTMMYGIRYEIQKACN